MVMHIIKKAIIIVFGLVIITSCNDEVKGTYGAKPMAMGRLNDMVVIADNDVWEGMPGDTFRHYFESAYPIMPNPEPMFDIRHFTATQINAEPLRKELRTYVILSDLTDTDSPTTKMVRKDIGEERYLKAIKKGELVTTVGKDKWARGQIIVYLFAKNETELSKAIKDKFAALAKRVRLHDEEQLLASIYTVKLENLGAIARIKERFGVDIKIPGNYKQVVDDVDQNIYWLRADDNESSTNIVLRSYDYISKDQISVDSIVALRNKYGKQYISGPTKGSYMVTNREDLPVYDYTHDIDGMYSKELRGIWEMENDFMGGPFITFTMIDQDRGKVLFVDAFVYAPGKQKRDKVQQLEYIIKHTKKI